MSADPLTDAIYALGVTDNPFNTAIDGDFIAEGFSEDTVPEKPYATYRIITMANNDQFRVNIERALIQIKIYSDDVSPSEADAINEKAFQLFHKTALTVTGYTGVRLFRENRIPAFREEDFYTSSIDFRTLIQEN